MKKVLFVVNSYSFFISHRLPIALKLIRLGVQVHVASGDSDLKGTLESQGINHHVFEMSPIGSNIIKELGVVFSLVTLYKKIKPDVIHHVTIKPVLYGSVAAKITKNKNVVNAISGLGFIFLNKGILHWVKRKLVEFLYVISFDSNFFYIVQNPDDYEKIIKLTGASKNKVCLVKGSGVDTNKLKPQGRINKDIRRVALISRMLVDKGVYEYVNAAKIVSKNYPEVEFILAGDIHHNPTSLTKDELLEFNNVKNVNWVGHVQDVKSLIETVDVVVLPSYREGLPKVLLEAASMARPVITTNVPGCRDAIIDKQTGLLVSVYSDIELANAILYLIKHPEEALNFGECGRLLAEKEFSIDIVVDKHIDIYRKLTRQISSS